VSGTLECSNCSGGGGTAGTVAISTMPSVTLANQLGTLYIANFPASQNINGTITVANPQTSVAITGVVTTNGTQTISGTVNTFGTTTIGGGTVSIAGVIPTTGTVQLATGSNSIGSISNSSFGVTGVVTTTGTQSINGVVTTVGTNAVSNFPAVQLVAGTMALSANASTATNQTSEISQLGTIGNALVNGTLNVSLGSKYATQTFSAASTGTLSITLGKGISEVTIDMYDPDNCTGDTCGSTDKIFSFYASIDGTNWRQISCSDGNELDDQIPVSTASTVGFFRCPVSGFETFKMTAGPGLKRAALNISASAAGSMIQQIQASINCANCSGSSGLGADVNVTGGTLDVSQILFPVTVNTHAVTQSGSWSVDQGTSPWVSNPTTGTLDVINTIGRITNTVTVGTHAVTQSGTWTVQPGNTQNTTPWLTMPAGGTLTKLTTVDTITNPVTVATHAVTESGTWTVQPGNTQNTTPWLTTSTGGTLTSIGTIVSGTMAIAAGSNVIGSISNSSFTANAGTNLNTSALALETGGNLAAMKTATDSIKSNTDTLVNDSNTIKATLTNIDAGTPAALGQTTKSASMPVTLASDQTVPIFGTVTSNPPLRSSVSISVNESAAATTAATWYKKRLYQVPSGSTFWPSRTKSVVTTAGSRTFIGTGVVMGSLNVGTNAFTDALAVSSPRFFSRMFGCVTTVLSATPDNITVTYTDNLGNTSHSTAAATFPASAPVGDCFEFTLAATTGQMRDTGFIDVTNITDSAATTGIIEIIGMNALHDSFGVANAYEMGSFDTQSIAQNEFIWMLFQQAATTAQQRGATILGSVSTP
jgi:hypothetical protein